MTFKFSQTKWFYYKLLAGLYTIGIILLIYIRHMVLKRWIGPDTKIPFSYVAFQSQFLSYWSMQSNIVIGLWFMMGVIFHHHQNKKIFFHQNVMLTMTTYISVTGFMYMSSLLFSNRIWEMDFITWFEALSQHFVVPILVVIFVLKNFEKNLINPKKYAQKYLLINLIYPITYFTFIFYRFFINWLDGVNPEVAFPYFPPSSLDLNQTNVDVAKTALTIFGFFAFGFCLFIIFNIGYVLLMNKIVNNSTNHHKSPRH